MFFCFMCFLNKFLSSAVYQPKNSVYSCIFTSWDRCLKCLIKVFQKMLEWNSFQKIFVKFMFPFKLNLVLKQIIRCVVFMIKKLLFWCLKVLFILLTFLDYGPCTWLFFCKYDAYVYYLFSSRSSILLLSVLFTRDVNFIQSPSSII